MSFQWLILLILISFLHLVITAAIDHSFTDTDKIAHIIKKRPTDIDTAYYYRLTNDYTGSKFALDIFNDSDTYSLKMTPISSHSGQFWYFVPLTESTYSLRTRLFGERYSLDIINDGINNKPHMAKTGSYSGQCWRITEYKDGKNKLTNDFTGTDKTLDVFSNPYIAHMSNIHENYSGQNWQLTKLIPINDC